MTDEAFVQAIHNFKTAQPSAAITGNDLCGIYEKVKPIINGVLPFLKLIPVYGATVAEALTALMTVLDMTCKTPAPAAAATA